MIVPAEATRAGENTIAIEFTAGDEALNRNDDFLYTLFVPARAHLTFPCFDQPDIKARYTLSLDVPAEWATVANAAEQTRDANATPEGRIVSDPPYDCRGGVALLRRGVRDRFPPRGHIK